jgi:methyltransferase
MRLVELFHSQRNLRAGGPADEGHWSRRTYPVMVGLHTFILAWTLLRGDRRPRPRWLLLFLAMQPLRFWVLLTLRNRWNTRGAVPRSLSVETQGPYALIRHPNYLVIVVELLTLPMAFGLPWLAAMATAMNSLLLIPRIREEERALMRFPVYRAHFANKRRFIPGVF